MGIDTDNLPPLWTALKVNCCNSRVFSGYLCGASDSSEADLVLCSMPEAKIIFVSGWAIEKIEVSYCLLIFLLPRRHGLVIEFVSVLLVSALL